MRFEKTTVNADVGETFKISVLINTDDYETNTIAAEIDYPSGIIEAVEIDSSKSVYEASAEEKISSGHISVTRYMNPGNSYQGQGEFFSITFKVLKAEEAQITFTDDSVLLDTNALEVSLDKTNMTVNPNSYSQVSGESNTSLYLLIGGAALLVVIMIAVFLITKRSKNQNDIQN